MNKLKMYRLVSETEQKFKENQFVSQVDVQENI